MFVALGLVTSCTSLPRYYSGEEVHGWVIDSVTKEPIRDVIVVEIWELEGGLHTDHTANIHIAETHTDEKGYYSFSKWGPTFTVDGTMSGSSPHLVFYKFGYDDASRTNAVSGNLNPDNSISEYSGKQIELEKFNGHAKEYHKKLGSIYSVLMLSHYRDSFDCMWVNIPMFTSAMIKAGSYFRENQIGTGFPSLKSLPEPGCDNPEEILKGYLK